MTLKHASSPVLLVDERGIAQATMPGHMPEQLLTRSSSCPDSVLIVDAGLDSFESYKVHLERGSTCRICSAKVHQTDRRAKSCPILAQVALAEAWTRAGMPEELVAADFRGRYG